MSVLAQNTARGDVLIRRGVSDTWGVKWEQKTDPQGTYEPVDLSDWSGVCQLRSDAGDVWAELPVTTSVDGLTKVVVPAAALTGPEWAGRRSGNWLINLTAPDAHVERLGDGYFYLED